MHSTKEIFLMIAECVQNAQSKTWRGTEESSILGLMADELRSYANDFPTDKPEREMPKGEYAECNDCASKPGSPTLCDVCLHNRALVGRLQEENRKLNNIVTKLTEPL